MRKLRLVKELNVLDAISLGISLILGSGVFLFPLIPAKEYGFFSIVGWIVGAIFAILMGLILSTLAIKMPKEGGPYSYVHKMFGDKIGFLIGWVFWFSYWMTIVVEVIALSFFLRIFFPELDSFVRLIISITALLLITFINYLGVKISGKVEDFLTILKITILIIFIITGLFAFKKENLFPLIPPDKNFISIFGVSAIFALYAYTGFEIITVPEEEIKKTKRIVRNAILISINITNLIFILIIFVLLGMMHWSKYGNYLSIAGVAKDVLGYNIGIIIAIGGIISVLGSINAVVLGSSRIAFSMAEDKLLPRVFEHINEKYKTPDYALIIQTILVILVSIILPDFELLAKFTVMLMLVVYFMTALATLKLSRMSHNKIFILETKIAPMIIVVLSIFLLLLFDIYLWLSFIALIIIGYIFYILEKKKI